MSVKPGLKTYQESRLRMHTKPSCGTSKGKYLTLHSDGLIDLLSNNFMYTSRTSKHRTHGNVILQTS